MVGTTQNKNIVQEETRAIFGLPIQNKNCVQ